VDVAGVDRQADAADAAGVTHRPVDHDARHPLAGRLGREQLAGDGAMPAAGVDHQHVARPCLLQRLEDLEEVRAAGDGERGADHRRRVGHRPDGRVQDAEAGVRVAEACRVERREPADELVEVHALLLLRVPGPPWGRAEPAVRAWR
jgi:hypothetical protein